MSDAAIATVVGTILTGFLAWIKADAENTKREVKALKKNICLKNPCADRINPDG